MFSFSPQFYSCRCSSWEILTSLIKALERGLLLLPKEILIAGVVPLLLRSGVHPCSTPSLPAANGKWTLNPSRVTGSGNGWGWKQRDVSACSCGAGALLCPEVFVRSPAGIPRSRQ